MADEYLYLNRTTGKREIAEFLDESAGAGSAGKPIAAGPDGKIDASFIPDAASPVTMTATEAISAGKYINIYNSTGAKIRLADSTNGYEAHGFALESISSSGTGPVQLTDTVNSLVSGLSVGVDYFLGAAGGVIIADDLPTASGSIIQSIGRGKAATELVGRIGDPIVNP